MEVFHTYVFDNDINTVADEFLANKIFVGTSKGLLYADKDDNLLDYENWYSDSKFSVLKDNSDINDFKNEEIPVVSIIGLDKNNMGGKRLLVGTNIDYSSGEEYNVFEF